MPKKAGYLERVLSIIKDLVTNPNGILKRDLAEKYGVSQRTIERYLQLLEGMYWYPIERERVAGEGTKVKISFQFLSLRQPHYPPDPREHLLIQAAEEHISYLKGVVGIDSYKIFSRLKNIVKASDLSYPKIYVHPEAPCVFAISENEFLKIVRALKDERRIQLILTDGKEVKFEPYTIVFYVGEIYLVGRCYGERRLSMFNLLDISGVIETSEKFDYPENFDPRERISSSFTIGVKEGRPPKVVLKFVPPMAEFVEKRIWHPSQRVLKHRDGSITLEMRVHSDESLIRWIVGFGPYVKIKKPQSLKQEVSRYLQGNFP